VENAVENEDDVNDEDVEDAVDGDGDETTEEEEIDATQLKNNENAPVVRQRKHIPSWMTA
jgi:hypothetical protein